MIGIDVGGANLKVVDDAGVHIRYCPLWQEAPLTEMLEGYTGRAAVVMSGELADSFTNKMQGIDWIVKAVRSALPEARFYGMDGAFHTQPVPELAAANWLASADYLRQEYADAVLLDVGSTTADIIPLGCFDTLKGLTDTLRLQRQYPRVHRDAANEYRNTPQNGDPRRRGDTGEHRVLRNQRGCAPRPRHHLCRGLHLPGAG